MRRPERSESQPRTKNGQPQYKHRWNGDQQLQPLLGARREEGEEIDAEDMAPHVEGEQRERERHGDGEPPGEIDQLRIVGDLRGHAHWLERHAADRAVAWPFLHDLRMHRTGVERALRQRLRLALLGQIALGVRCELGTAAGRAEPIGLAAMLEARPARADIDLHPAYRVGGHMRGALGHLGCVVVHRGWALPRRELDSVMDLAAVVPRING